MNRIRLAWRARSLGLFAALLLATSAQAGAIEVFNTGVDAAGTPLANGAVDPHWTLIDGPGVTTPVSAVVVNNQHPVGQYFQTADSKWIWSVASGAAVVGATYTFRLEFDLTGMLPDTAVLSGGWGADNVGSISFNGAAPVGTGTFELPTVSLNNFNVVHSFTITDGFVAGINYIDFRVVDAGNPGGLNVTGLVASAAPEPASMLLFGCGALLLVGPLRRRRAAVTG